LFKHFFDNPRFIIIVITWN